MRLKLKGKEKKRDALLQPGTGYSVTDGEGDSELSDKFYVGDKKKSLNTRLDRIH